MATFADSLVRIRRFLRDPAGTIHTDEQLRRYWDAAQREVAVKTGFLERAEAYSWPARFQYAYCHPWEPGDIEGDGWLWGMAWAATGWLAAYPWEAGYMHDGNAPPDEGTRLTQPWEAAHVTPADILPIQTHTGLGRVRFAAYDEEPIQSATQRAVAKADGYYRTRAGEAKCHYPLDESDRLVTLYPRPPVVLAETEDSDVYDDAAGIVLWTDSYRDSADYGLVVDSVDTENALFMVYEALPTPAYDSDTETGWPDWTVHYVECGVLERAFGADTDGFHPSLRDYWRARRELAVEMLKRFRTLRLRDQDFQMGRPVRARRIGRGPSMPDHYPEAW